MSAMPVGCATSGSYDSVFKSVAASVTFVNVKNQYLFSSGKWQPDSFSFRSIECQLVL